VLLQNFGGGNDWFFIFYDCIVISNYDLSNDITRLIMKKLKHEVDSVIVDLIMEHFNIQSFEGLKQNLTVEEFDEILEVAKEMYYMDMLKSMKHNMPKS
jgi:energy-converting hydrogenase A subunit M